jgi:hypothetical protein
MHLSAEIIRPEHERPLRIAVKRTSREGLSRSLLASLMQRRALTFRYPNQLQLVVAGTTNDPCQACKGLLDALGPVQTFSEKWVYPPAPPGVPAFCYVRLTHGLRVRVYGYGESLVDISFFRVHAENDTCLRLGRKIIHKIACLDWFELVEGTLADDPTEAVWAVCDICQCATAMRSSDCDECACCDLIVCARCRGLERSVSFSFDFFGPVGQTRRTSSELTFTHCCITNQLLCGACVNWAKSPRSAASTHSSLVDV